MEMSGGAMEMSGGVMEMSGSAVECEAMARTHLARRHIHPMSLPFTK